MLPVLAQRHPYGTPYDHIGFIFLGKHGHKTDDNSDASSLADSIVQEIKADG